MSDLLVHAARIENWAARLWASHHDHSRSRFSYAAVVWYGKPLAGPYQFHYARQGYFLAAWLRNIANAEARGNIITALVYV